MNNVKRAGWRKLAALMCIVPMVLTACGAPGTGEQASEKKEEGGKKTITISVTDTDRFLQYAEQMYEEAHPDIDIVIKPYREPQELAENQMAMAMTQEEFEKYVSTINTEMMSGKGPDILSLSGIPVGKYAAKDLLVNYYDLMKDDTDFKKGDYFQNVWKSMEVNGGLYELPVDVKLNMIRGNKKLLDQAGVTVKQPWTWKEFVDATQQVKRKVGDDIFAEGNSKPQFYLYNLVQEHYLQLVDSANKQAHFDTPLFRELIEQVEDMFKNGTLTEGEADVEHALFSKTTILDPTSYIQFDDHITLSSPSVDKNNNQLSFYATTFGVNSNSSVKKEAWSFLKFLLSGEIQESPEMKGLPMNKDSYNKKFDELAAQAKDGTVKTKFGEIPTTKTPEELEKFRPLIEQANAYINSDTKVLDIVSEEIKTYFAGEKPLDEVIKLIQSRTMTYLNE